MRKIYFVCSTLVYLVLFVNHKANSQCTFVNPYGSATINNTIPGNVVTITTCQYGGEYAPLTFNVTGAFTFSSSVPTDYLTLTNASNSVVAFGLSPLNVTIATTGMYYLHTAASGPPACAIQNTCRTTEVKVPVPPCAGTPVTGTAAASQALICPNNTATITLPGASTGTGLLYQWFASTTGSLGLFTSIPGASQVSYTTIPTLVPITTWYKAVLTCTNGGVLSATSAPVSVDIAGTTINSIPYSEGFEGALLNNQLPNCSWKASNMPTTCQTYLAPNTNNRVPHNGNKFASFYYLPASTSYFYTNGLQLNAGVTYSASMWYTTEYYTYNNWSNLSMLIGPNQSTLGLNTVASSNGTAASPTYKSLSNTFSVATSGIYYLAIKATSNGACCAQYLSFDDVAVTIPCELNTPTVALNSSGNSICNGQSVTLSIMGADTYQWSTGASTTSVNISPSMNSTISVICTNTNSGCSYTASQAITVLPVDPISIYTASSSICPGQSANLTAFGVNTYSWNTNATGALVTVSPLITTSYSVVGVNSSGCSSQAAITITVNGLPNVTASTAHTLICAHESVQLTAQGALSYQWTDGVNLYQSAAIVVSPLASTMYTVFGTNSNGCTNFYALVQNVVVCNGLETLSTGSSKTIVRPNPNQGMFQIEFNSEATRNIELMDALGRVVISDISSARSLEMNISNLSNGIYYLKIHADQNTQFIKIIKQ